MELLSLVVLALLQAKDVRHAELAERFPGSAQTSSVIRRIERFFNHHPLCPADVAVVVLKLLPEARKREFILDRTNWKLGQSDVNALVLAVLWRGVAVPLLFELLPHGGSSRTEIRLTLMSDVLCLLSCREIAMLYADREFIGQDWITKLSRAGIPLCVRLRQDTFIDGSPARDWLQGLQPGMKGILVDRAEVYGQPMNVVLTYTQDGEALVIASTSGSASRILSGYRKRFRIECLFRALKSKGFKLESTHMTLHENVERLLCLLTLAYVWCVLVGLLQTCTVKVHGRRAWSVVTLGLRTLVRTFARIHERGEVEALQLIGLLKSSQTLNSEGVGY